MEGDRLTYFYGEVFLGRPGEEIGVWGAYSNVFMVSSPNRGMVLHDHVRKLAGSKPCGISVVGAIGDAGGGRGDLFAQRVRFRSCLRDPLLECQSGP